MEVNASKHYEEKEGDYIRPRSIENMEFKSCPVFNTFNIIGKKFSILILRNMIYDKQTRFNEFLNSIEEINPKTLSIRLKEMEKDGLIRRQVYDETPIRIEYYLTQKGKELQPILEQMALFSVKYCCDQIFDSPDPIKIEKITAKSLRKYI
ncbi:MAG: winged helix-turn-helix transcriptional regulator [Candidatus Nitrosocosmicus sp.]|uniref:winged helix-turn-helix transcriptional regulator n=1 Tax=Candidatus Nitrosocosmicus sp. FF01 TaxID=3397670 RepID=UPI0039E7DD0F